MKLVTLKVSRMPGIDEPFQLDQLASGLNLIVGSNGSGKTTLRRALSAMLWPDESAPMPVDVASTWQRDDSILYVERQGNRVLWQQGGEDTHAPALPEGRLGRCFTPSLSELLVESETDADLAQTIRLRIAGGYDVHAVMNGEVLKRGGSRYGAAEERKFQKLDHGVQQLASRHAQLAQDEQELAPLRVQREQAQAAAEGLQRFDAAVRLYKANARCAAARVTLEHFLPGMDQLTGDEAERLSTLQEKLDRAQGLATEAQEGIRRAQLEQSECGLQNGPPSEAAVAEHLQRTAKLSELSRSLEEHERQRDAADARRKHGHTVLRGSGQSAQIDADILDKLDRYIQRAQRVREHDLKFEAELAVLGAAAPASEEVPLNELVREAKGHLGSAASLGWLKWWAVGLGVACVVAGAIGVLSHLLWGALILVGLAGIGGAFWLGQSRDEALRQRYVISILDQIAVRAAAVDPAGALQERRKAIVAQRETLSQEQTELQGIRDNLIELAGLNPGSSELTLAVLSHSLVAYLEATQTHLAAVAKCDAMQQVVRSELAQVNTFLREHGEIEVKDGVAARAKVDSLHNRAVNWRQAKNGLATARRETARAKERAQELTLQRDRIFAECALEAGDRVGLHARLEQLQDFGKAREILREAELAVRVHEEQLQAYPGWFELDADELTADRQKQEGLAAGYDDLSSEITTTETRIADARAGEEVQDAMAQRDHALDDLSRRRDEALFGAAGRFLLEQVAAEHEQRSRPPVLEKASKWFGAFTHYAYELKVDTSAEDQNAGFVAVDTRTGRGLKLAQLSDGTRVQLLLAVRLAFADSAEQGVQLPFVLDEALSNSDPARFQAVIDSLVTLVQTEQRQVIYLTSQPVDAARWNRAMGDVKVVDLDAIRNRAAAPADKLKLPPLPQIPSPEGCTVSQYGDLIGVPRFDPQRPVSGLHLFYLMTDKLPALWQLLKLGIVTLGQFRSLVRAGRSEAYIAESDGHRVKNLALLSDRFVQGWREGKGRPISREVLVAAGVSSAFIDGLSELAAELEYDAHQLLEALDAREDERTKGFRQKAQDELRLYLEKEGYYDPSPVLSRDDLRLRVLHVGAPLVESKMLSLEAVSGHFELLWRLTDPTPALSEPSSVGTKIPAGSH